MMLIGTLFHDKEGVRNHSFSGRVRVGHQSSATDNAYLIISCVFQVGNPFDANPG
jgi:hypothetical protein